MLGFLAMVQLSNDDMVTTFCFLLEQRLDGYVSVDKIWVFRKKEYLSVSFTSSHKGKVNAVWTDSLSYVPVFALTKQSK